MHSTSSAMSTESEAAISAYAATSNSVEESPLRMNLAKNITKLKTNVFNAMARISRMAITIS